MQIIRRLLLLPPPPSPDEERKRCKQRDDQVVEDVRRELRDTREKVEMFVERMRG
jgi:hypothetical protein